MASLNFKDCKSVVNTLLALFKVPEVGTPSIPLPLRLGAKNKPGMNSERLFGEVMQKFDEIGLISSDLDRAKTKVLLDSMVDHIKINAKGSGTFNIGGINILGQGENAGGPVVIRGQNINLPDIVTTIE